MNKVEKKSLDKIFDEVEYLPNRAPEMAFSGGSEDAFAEVSAYRDGAVYVGYYSGNSEWERHTNGDEFVMAIEGSTTLVLLVEGEEQRFPLQANEVLVVPQNVWHRFEQSNKLKVMTITPQPTDHSLDKPTV